MMSPETLNSYTRKMLTDLARRRGIAGWHGMNKAELVAALTRKAGRNGTPLKEGVATNGAAKSAKAAGSPQRGHARNGHHPKQAASNGHARNGTNGVSLNGSAKRGKANGVKRGSPSSASPARLPRIVGETAESREPRKERFVVLVRDPYWLHAYWELNRETVRRAEAALGAEWHSALPVLRLLDVSHSDQTRTAEAQVRDIEIHGGVNHWYIPVDGRPRAYRLQIGYRTPHGRFFVLARSNIVKTPDPSSPSEVDGNWHDLERNYERVFSLSGGFAEATADSPVRELFQQHLRRSLGQPGEMYGGCLPPNRARRGVNLDLQVELILHGATQPGAHLTLQGEHAGLREDGSFLVRLNLQEGRHLIPVVAVSADGLEQRTIVLSVDRNTKELEAQPLEDG